MPRRKSEPEKSARVLILKLAGDKESMVEIPMESKVTFGPAIPGGKGNGWVGPDGRLMEYAVRIYSGATEKSGLLAVFTGVREFREQTIKVKHLVIREAGKALWKSDESGVEYEGSVKKTKHLLEEEF